MWSFRAFNAEHEQIAEIGLRPPTAEEIRETPDGIPHAGRFTREVTIPVDGYLVLLRSEKDIVGLEPVVRLD